MAYYVAVFVMPSHTERMIYMFTYKTNGTCSTQIDLEIQDGVSTYCKFTSG